MIWLVLLSLHVGFGGAIRTLETVVVCGLVGATPACSDPLVRGWDHFNDDFDVEPRAPTQERYEADLDPTPTGVRVRVRSKNNVAELASQWPIVRDEPETSSRVLAPGQHPLTELLTRRFVELPAP